jgi:hypothetical protein
MEYIIRIPEPPLDVSKAASNHPINCPIYRLSTVSIEGGERDIKSRDFWGIKFRYY